MGYKSDEKDINYIGDGNIGTWDLVLEPWGPLSLGARMPTLPTACIYLLTTLNKPTYLPDNSRAKRL